MRAFVGIAAVLLAMGCGRDDTPEPDIQYEPEPNPPAAVPAEEVLKQADGLYYREGEIHPFTGRTEAFHPDKTKRGEFGFRMGIPDGSWQEWHPNGNQRRKFHYISGKLDGECVEWHANGTVKWRANFRMDQPHGDWNEWDNTGLHALKRSYQNGLLVSEVMPVELMQRVTLITQLRDRFDRFVWQPELDAQRFHQTLVAAWDALRSANDKFSELGKLEFGTLEISPGEPMTPADWKGWLDKRLAEGWEIKGTHWRHEKFSFEDKNATSEYAFTLRAQNGKRRIVLRGALDVDWSERLNGQDNFIPETLVVRNLQHDERTSDPGFVEQANLRSPGPVLVHDLNRDGLPEILFPAVNTIHWNRGGWKFERKKMFQQFNRPLMAAVLADFTGDGLVDLMGVPPGGTPWLWAGVQKGVDMFSNPKRVSATDENWKGASAIAAGDVDGDGDLDAWFTHHKPPFVEGQFPLFYFDANDGEPSRLLLNGGKGNFTEAPAPNLRKRRRTRSSSWVDLDGDGDLDLINVAGYGGLDHYANDGHGKFTDLNGTLGTARYAFGQGHAVGDFNGDGRPDVFMAGVDSATARRMDHLKLGHAPLPAFTSRRDTMASGNRLFLGSKKGLAFAPSKSRTLERTGWAHGASSADFDLDGDRDLFVANGHASRGTAEDYDSIFWRHDVYTQNNKPDVALAAHFEGVMGPVRENLSWHGFEPNALLLNDGKGGWREAGFLLGAGSQHDGRSVVTADFDADGRPDLLVTERRWEFKTGLDVPHVRLMANRLQPAGGWVGVHLLGAAGRPVVGAVVTARAGGKIWRHWVVTGDSWAAQHPFTAHFGLGEVAALDTLEVRWPDGSFTRIQKPAVGKYHPLNASQAKLDKSSEER